MMTNKAYIVANEQQEREVLEKLERLGAEWHRSSKKPTDFIPTHDEYTVQLPYILLVENDQISWCDIKLLSKFDIVYDGRKEEQMSEKYVVSQEFMNVLEDGKNNLTKYNEPGYFIDWEVLQDLPTIVIAWWGDEVSNEESNNRLIAIIRWVNGEDVFEVEKTKKWVVHSKSLSNSGNYWYVLAREHNMTDWALNEDGATKFDTKEEAENWANAHQEVVQVEVD
ncbi:hypothetical protein AB0Y39_02015 [Weissella paramesenteroides]|uniref:hypothetical protein n=1 Tax=Weissella paramesenteroides TaxID=1249 RepID=UPI003F20DA0A